MPIIPVLALIYAGMLIENPKKREQFMGFVNEAGVSIEKAINSFMSMEKGGETKNEAPEPEPTEFH